MRAICGVMSGRRAATSPDSGSTKRSTSVGIERAETSLEDLGELEDRGRDDGVPVQREAIEHAARERSAASPPLRARDRAFPPGAGARATERRTSAFVGGDIGKRRESFHRLACVVTRSLRRSRSATDACGRATHRHRLGAPSCTCRLSNSSTRRNAQRFRGREARHDRRNRPSATLHRATRSWQTPRATPTERKVSEHGLLD